MTQCGWLKSHINHFRKLFPYNAFFLFDITRTNQSILDKIFFEDWVLNTVRLMPFYSKTCKNVPLGKNWAIPTHAKNYHQTFDNISGTQKFQEILFGMKWRQTLFNGQISFYKDFSIFFDRQCFCNVRSEIERKLAFKMSNLRRLYLF